MEEPMKKGSETDVAGPPSVEQHVVFLGEVYQETRNAVSFGFNDDMFKFFSVYG